VFAQLSRAIGRRVKELQSNGKKVAHMGPKGKNNLANSSNAFIVSRPPDFVFSSFDA